MRHQEQLGGGLPKVDGLGLQRNSVPQVVLRIDVDRAFLSEVVEEVHDLFALSAPLPLSEDQVDPVVQTAAYNVQFHGSAHNNDEFVRVVPGPGAAAARYGRGTRFALRRNCAFPG